MALSKQKVNLYERRIARLKKDVEQQRTLRREMSTAFANAKVQYADIVASHMVSARKATDTVTQQAFKISELENQLAVQFKQNAALSQDLQKATKRYNENVTDLIDKRKQLVNAIDVCEEMEKEIKQLKLKFGYRLWVAITIWLAGVRMAITMWFAHLKTIRKRIEMRFKIWRLSKARLSAINEAGWVPEKLVKAAIAYYEHDKARMEIDDQIREIHYGGNMQGATDKELRHFYAKVDKEIKPSIWRRWNIFLGRA
jgi:DNA repair exonuclease SbcCD ATPase subunit